MKTEAVCPLPEHKRFDVTILGTVIGTAGGWDEMGSDCLMFYAFKPNRYFGHAIKNPYKEMYESITVNFTTGVVESFEDGNPEPILSTNICLDISVH